MPRKKKDPSAPENLNVQKVISIRVPRDVLDKTKQRAIQFGLPYQTFMKLLIDQGHQYIDDHGSLSVPIKSPEEAQALRTAQRRAELAARRAANGEVQDPTSAQKRRRTKKGTQEADPLAAAEREAAQIRQELGLDPSQAPEVSQAPSKSNGVHAPISPEQFTDFEPPSGTRLCATCGKPQAPDLACGCPIEPATDSLEEPAETGERAPDMKGLSALVHSIGQDGELPPFARGPEPITPEDIETLKGEPEPVTILVPGITIEEPSRAHCGMDPSVVGACGGTDDSCSCECNTCSPIEHRPPRTLDEARNALDHTPSDADVREALAELEAMLPADSEVSATIEVKPAPKVEPIAPPTTIDDPDLADILALI